MSLRPRRAGSRPVKAARVRRVPGPRPPAGGAYRERLFVPVSYWLLAVLVALTLGAEAYFFTSGFLPPLVIAALYAVMAVFLVNWGSATIEVTGPGVDGTGVNGTGVNGPVVRAGKETLALSEASEAIALDEKQAMALRGPKADPSARILLRPYLKRAVYIALADPGKGVPYWLLATRRPEDLAAAIERALRQESRPPVG